MLFLLATQSIICHSESQEDGDMDALGTQTQARHIGRPVGDRREAIYRRDNYRCVYCGCQVIPGAHTSDPLCATLDHVLAHVKGGTWDDSVTCCSRCNSKKGARPVEQFIAIIARELRSGKGAAAVAALKKTITRRITAALAKEI